MTDKTTTNRKTLFDVLWKLARASDPWWVRLMFLVALMLGSVACVALAGGAVARGALPVVHFLLGR